MGRIEFGRVDVVHDKVRRTAHLAIARILGQEQRQPVSATYAHSRAASQIKSHTGSLIA